MGQDYRRPFNPGLMMAQWPGGGGGWLWCGGQTSPHTPHPTHTCPPIPEASPLPATLPALPMHPWRACLPCYYPTTCLPHCSLTSLSVFSDPHATHTHTCPTHTHPTPTLHTHTPHMPACHAETACRAHAWQLAAAGQTDWLASQNSSSLCLSLSRSFCLLLPLYFP